MARSFNGSSDFITLANDAALNPTAAITISMWIQTSSGATTQYMVDTGSNSVLLGVTAGGTAHKLSTFLTSVTGGWVSGATSIDDGNWHQIAVSYDQAGVVRLWVDGLQDGSSTPGAHVIQTSANPLTIAERQDILSRYVGSIADFAFWNVALSSAEQYALGKRIKKPGDIRAGSLVRWLPLDGYGHPALDLSRYKRNGVLTGTALAVGPPLLNPAPQVVSFSPKHPPAAVVTAVSRRTLSDLGTRTGSRNQRAA